MSKQISSLAPSSKLIYSRSNIPHTHPMYSIRENTTADVEFELERSNVCEREDSHDSHRSAPIEPNAEPGIVIGCVDDDSGVNKEVTFTYEGTSSNLADTTYLTLYVPENPYIDRAKGDFIFNDLRSEEVIKLPIEVEEYLLPTALENYNCTGVGKTLAAKAPLRNVFKERYPVSLDNMYLNKLCSEDKSILQGIVGVKTNDNTMIFMAVSFDELEGQAIWEAKSVPTDGSRVPEPTVNYNFEEIGKDAAFNVMDYHKGAIEYQKAS